MSSSPNKEADMIKAALVMFGAVALWMLVSCAWADNPYSRPMKPMGLSAQGVALPARSIGPNVLRARPSVAIEVLVHVEDFLPRALEPRLIVDGQLVQAPSRVVDVDGNVTTIGFLLEKPALVRDGAKVEIQMGD